ncbi:Gfo/Idh/MocA family protein [Streptomyces caatingaensis]|uniref:1,5-anhydro-D-fructose reductase n=1 Tax=Streptomyces caatingaensis TaxID=1678637 RepID=A0A0K9XL61_9ACTN|nr:Gfo/Idh/MocA family oxidoreductase [Streptomyces caatingaensis]KNB54028.1 1,5-anhydro-D-fructose reductase [Streptomyces caatingaensis]
MKIALLGTGFGRAHAAVYAARGDVDVVMFGRDAEKTAEVAGRFGFAASTDMDAAFDDASFDLVDICLPVPLHAPYTLRALEAGKHVLVELPLAGSMEDAERVAEAAARSDRQVFVDMFERFVPANQALFDAVREGAHGRLEQLTLWNLTAHLWPGASLGLKVLPLEAMHSDMDVITRTLGLPQDLTVTTVARDDDSGAVDAVLRFGHAMARSSVSSLMPTSWGARGGYTAVFEHGVLDASSTTGFDGKPSGTVTVYTPDGAHDLVLPPADQYTAMIGHVMDVLHGKAANRIAPDSVLDALRLTLDLDRKVNSARRARP